MALQFLSDVAAGEASQVPVPAVAAPRLRLVDRRRPEGAALRRQVAQMSNAELRTALLTDPLTGLGNARALRETQHGAGTLAVDVVKFKEINDTYGHENADRVLQTIGRVLGELAGPGRAFRPYGDEFVGDFDSIEAARQAADALEARVAAATVGAEMPAGRRETIRGLRVHTGVGRTAAEAGHDLNARAGGAVARRRRGADRRRPHVVVRLLRFVARRRRPSVASGLRRGGATRRMAS